MHRILRVKNTVFNNRKREASFTVKKFMYSESFQMRKVGQEGRNAFILEGSDIYQPRIVCLPHYFIKYKNYLRKLSFYWGTRILGNKFILSINYVRKNGKMKMSR
jgi:hypothetical protein